MKSRLFALILLLPPSIGFASTKELDTAVITASHYARAPMPRADRYALAKAALAYWQSFDSRIPRNSPAIAEWLTKELSTTDGDRVGRVLSTPEYAIRTLSETSEQCVSTFKLLVDSPQTTALTEMYLWTKTLSCYRSPADILEYLQRGGLSNGRWDGPFSIQHFSFYHDTITGYLANGVIEDGQNTR